MTTFIYSLNSKNPLVKIESLCITFNSFIKRCGKFYLYSSSLFVDRSKSLHPYYSPYIANTGRIPYVLVAASLLASPYCETKAYVCELDTFRNQ